MNIKLLLFSIALILSLTTGCSSSDSETDSGSNSGSDSGSDSDSDSDSDSGSGSGDSDVVELEYINHEESDDYIWDSSSVKNIVFNENSVTTDSTTASIDGSIITLTSADNYSVSGSLVDGQIIIDLEDTEETLRLIFDGVDISNSTTAPIFVKNSEKVVIVLAENSHNYITDAETYVYDDAEEDEPNSAIFSKDDLSIYGNGFLTVNANYNDGIKSKDGLVIASGNLTINSVDDGIVGKDYLVINGGTITANVEGDGIKSTNDDEEKGFVLINDGTLNITSANDSIQAESNIKITGGEFTLTSGGGSNANLSEDDSAKGLKATVAIIIEDGNFSINSADDAIHSNNSIQIDEGTFDIASGDDGVHSDTTLTLNQGDINISKSYEGIESAIITVNDGNIHIVSSDDGLNVAGGNNDSNNNEGNGPNGGGGGQPGQDNFESSGDYYFYMNGGSIVIDADGDGVDINGSAEMTNGSIIVNGPTANNNGALDYDGTFKITGGFLLAAGSSRMAQAPSSSSTQNSLLLNLNPTLAAGTLFHIQTSAGEEVLSFAPSKQYASISFSSPDLITGTSYNVYYDGSSTGSVTDGLYEGGVYTPGTLYTSFTISNSVTQK